MLHYEWNQLEEANQLLQQAVILAERSGNVEIQGTAYRNIALLKQAKGEKAEALTALEKAVKCIGKSAPPLTKGRNAAAYVKVFLAQGNLAGAVRSAQNMFPASASSFLSFILRLLVFPWRRVTKYQPQRTWKGNMLKLFMLTGVMGKLKFVFCKCWLPRLRQQLSLFLGIFTSWASRRDLYADIFR